MASEPALNALIDRMYSAILGYEDVNAVLAKSAELAGFGAASVVVIRDSGEQGKCVNSVGVDIADIEQAEKKYAVSGTVAHLHRHGLAPGELRFRNELISLKELRAQPFYSDFVAPNKFEDGVMLCLENSPERSIVVNLGRCARTMTRDRQRRTLESLAPHAVRAYQVWQQLTQLRLVRAALWETVNLAPVALVILDNCGAVFLANSKAEALLGNDGLALARGGLHATLKADDACLQQAINTVIASTNSRGVPLQSADLLVHRGAGKRPYQLMIAPLPPDHEQSGRRPAASLMIFDPEQELGASFARMRDLFGFTRAEAVVALGLMQGKSLEQVALAEGNSVATARNLLKRVFQKAGVSRQNDLTRLLLNSPLRIDIESALKRF